MEHTKTLEEIPNSGLKRVANSSGPELLALSGIPKESQTSSASVTRVARSVCIENGNGNVGRTLREPVPESGQVETTTKKI